MPKPVQAVLVDAHNLLHRLPELRVLLRDDAEAARHELERRLRGRRLWLFYDGGPGGEPRRTLRHGHQIVYSGPREADADIVAWLDQHPRLRAGVVTADRELRGRCRARGATLWDLDAFAARYLERTGPLRNETSDRGPPPAHEVEDWLQAFGGDEEF